MNDYIPGHIPAVITLSIIVGILLIGFILLMVYLKKIKPNRNEVINTQTPLSTASVDNDIDTIITPAPTSDAQQPVNLEIKEGNINTQTVTASPTDSSSEPTNPETKEGDNNNTF